MPDTPRAPPLAHDFRCFQAHGRMTSPLLWFCLKGQPILHRRRPSQTQAMASSAMASSAHARLWKAACIMEPATATLWPHESALVLQANRGKKPLPSHIPQSETGTAQSDAFEQHSQCFFFWNHVTIGFKVYSDIRDVVSSGLRGASIFVYPGNRHIPTLFAKQED